MAATIHDRALEPYKRATAAMRHCGRSTNGVGAMEDLQKALYEVLLERIRVIEGEATQEAND